MQYKINLSRSAQADINAIADYIADNLQERQTALQLIRGIRTAIASLQKMPERYPVVRDAFLASMGIRMFPVNRYLVFYTVDHANTTVNVLNVKYGRREWIGLLSNEWNENK